ncbi:E3 ubiquitin-protein ligase TRIM71-like [Actinia tenebrosa]|uniref:E3 ubiquitin-protein ligase TRIM71-like n=1 Tax=Actinia tenebrosa TaxID=6105 RepID=A0A6P8IWA8_ACTTE|nr:E3 ubiquitin-protein ligase TRIM71-like [Actinia tenebrosa]
MRPAEALAIAINFSISLTNFPPHLNRSVVTLYLELCIHSARDIIFRTSRVKRISKNRLNIIIQPTSSNLANMESFVDDLKKEVQCSLCNDTLTEPKILPCFDTFCKPCIKRHAELIEEVNVFKCPRCKSQTPLPEPSSVDDLQPSLLHSRISKGLALVEGKKVCSVSESHSSASCYCFDCDRSMCEECKNYHSEFIKDHKVVCLADLKKEDIEFVITRENPCKSHPSHRLELFCEDCEDMICLTCLKHDHKDHKTISLDKFALIKKAVLSKHLQVLEQLRLDDKEKQQQEKIANTIKQQGEKAKKEVKDKTKKIIEMLQENERELLRQIDEKLNTATTNLNIIHHSQNVEKYIKNEMERGLASETMNIQETHCSERFIFNYIPLSSRIAFVPNEQLVQEVNSGLGEIRTCLKTDHTKSTIEVQSETEALKKESLVLITKASTGQGWIQGSLRDFRKLLNFFQSYTWVWWVGYKFRVNYSCPNPGSTPAGEFIPDPKDVIHIKISPEENVKIEKKYVRTDGKVEVEFMAKVAGQLTAEVQVNGNHVSNSPLVVNVKPQEMKTTGKFNMKFNLRSSSLRGIAVNRDNCRIAVVNCSSHCVHVFTSDGDLLLTYCSPGRAQGQLSNPVGLSFLNDTDLVIADHGNHRICIVNTTTGKLVKTFGNQGNRDGEFSNPCGVHIDEDGNIIVCDGGNHRVRVFTREGDYQYQFGLTAKDNFTPYDVITHDGQFYVSDYNNHVIHVFEKKGNVPTRVSTIGGKGSADGQLNRPWGLAIDNDHHLLVCDIGNNRVQKFTLDGRFVGKTCDVIKNPTYITVLKDGQLLVSTYGSGVWCVK